MKPTASFWAVIRVIVAAIVGGLVGEKAWPSIERVAAAYPRAGVGALLFAGASVLIGPLIRVMNRIRESEWTIEDVELKLFRDSLKIKFATNEVERRIAWSLFVELSTRIATQAMEDDDGDNGVALSSLYSLFQTTRLHLTELLPNRTPPKHMRGAETVESYALRLLNSELRPYLAKWHPRWEAWHKENPEARQVEWSEHTNFRTELRGLQENLRKGTIDLGTIAGIDDAGRYLELPNQSGPSNGGG